MISYGDMLDVVTHEEENNAQTVETPKETAKKENNEDSIEDVIDEDKEEKNENYPNIYYDKLNV